MQTAGLTSGTYYYSESAQSVPLELKHTGVELEFIIQVYLCLRSEIRLFL